MPNEQLPASEDTPVDLMLRERLRERCVLDYSDMARWEAKLDHIKALYRQIYGADVHEPIGIALEEKAARDVSTALDMTGAAEAAAGADAETAMLGGS